MANQRNTNIYDQSSLPPMLALSPELLISNTEEIDSLPSSIDIEYTLSDSLSSLNLSQNNHCDPQMFLQQTLDQQVIYSGPFWVDPILQQHHTYSPGFDPHLHLDYGSYLFAKELVSSPQHQESCDSHGSSNPWAAAISKERVDHNGDYIMPGDYSLNNPFLSLMTLQELRKLICVLAKDEFGCEILKSKIENPTEKEVDIVLYEVAGSIVYLMKHQFGTSLIQKLICVCNDDQKAFIVSELTVTSLEIIRVCMNPNGTRAVQKLLENLKSPDQIIRVIRALQVGVVQLANDPNGHRVLHYCLAHFDCDFNQLIVDQIADNCLEVATGRSGCCLMQTCMEFSRGEVRNRLVSKIMANAIQIAEDPFGNYVLQHMVGLRSPGLTELLVRQLEGNFATLSQNKYASNVVEKCLMESRPDISTKIILELVGSSNPSSLLVDPYGNFVIQSALKVSKGFAYKCLLKLVSSNVSSMQSNLYGKKILEKIEKRRSFTYIQDLSGSCM